MCDVEAERYPPAAEWFFAELALLRGRWDVFAHPFYERWSSCELRAGELRDYAEEHDHLVVALATVAQRAAQKADGLLGDVMAKHVAVVEGRIAQWREFAAETGWGAGTAWHYASEAYPETIHCVDVWLGDPGRSLAIDLVTLAAAEPEPDPVIRAGLAGLLAGEDPFAVLAHAEAVHRAYWTVLDVLEGAVQR